MTGRAAGYCAGYYVPGYMNPHGGGPAFGVGMGYAGAPGYYGASAYPGGWYAPPGAAWGWPYPGWGAYPMYAGPFWRGRRFFGFGRGRGRGRGRWW